MAKNARVVRPSWAWFTLLDGGLVALAVLSTNQDLHASVSESLPAPLPARPALRKLLGAAIAVHVGEAMVATRMARRRGLPARGWALQTFIVGFPSLGKLRRLPV
ncbi:MAG TPA: DUF4499 domain-containing protein [Acidimicrobiales bacterium]|jgi:hypothetical protein|nr:DUF4499 domain-containing protein [Acidimicrobiales bacterium]